MKVFGKLLRSSLAVVVLLSIFVSIGIIIIRNTGMLERAELVAYDSLFRLRSTPPQVEPRIALITITDADIQNQGRWPITDSVLAKALQQLAAYQPRAIGVDIYRDLAVSPGQKELEQVLTNNRNIITIMKVGETGVAAEIPPPPVATDEQIGFSDVLIDRDGIVRRALLFLDDGKKVFHSFALQLSLLYLQPVAIVPQPDALNSQQMRLGNITIPPLEANDGGYVDTDSRGYQFLLDFKEENFPSYSLTQLVSGQIDQDAIKDKIVLVGVAAGSVPHQFYTPFKSSISGLALHATIISQLLRFGLEGSSPIRTLDRFVAIFWITLWGLLGGALGIWARSTGVFSFAASGSFLLLAFSAYIAFLQSWWIPLVTPALSLFTSAVVSTVYMRNREKEQLRRFVLADLTRSHRSPTLVLFADVVPSSDADPTLRCGVYEKSPETESTIRHYESHNVQWQQVEARCNEVVRLLNRANSRASVTLEILDSLKKTGQGLFELLIPQKARAQLDSASTRDLILSLDDKTVEIPWELLFDGRDFLSRRFATGRVITTQAGLTSRSTRILKPPFKVLIIADPRRDLPRAYREGIQIRGFLDKTTDVFDVVSKTQSVDVGFVKMNLRDFDAVHYAGHAVYDPQNPSASGWLLNDGRLSAREVFSMGGLTPMPALVFSNACQTGAWQLGANYEQDIFGLANAFLRAGVQHYIGSFGDIADEQSAYFAKQFYKSLAQGEAVGEAVRKARVELIDAKGESTLVWASYMLYGDPTFHFPIGRD